MVEPVRSWPDVVPGEDRTLGWAVLAWTADWLQQPDGPDAGEPWVFTDEQARMVLRWYEVDDAGRFVYRRGVVRRMKGWGKDPFLAAIAAAELCGPCRFGGWDRDGKPRAVPHSSPWIQVAAVAKDQTRNTMTLFPGMFTPAAVSEYRIDLGKEIIYAGRNGRLEAVTSSPRALEGGRPSLVILNESHHWLANNDGLEMASAIRRNLGKSRDGSARAVEITNAHQPGEGSAAEETFEAWRAAQLRGEKVPGVYYDSVEAPMRLTDDGDPVPIADLSDEELREGLLAARGDSVWLDIDRVLAEIRDPATKDSISRRFYLNQVAAAEETWLDLKAWQACRADVALADGDRVTLGFDGSLRDDSTALVACRVSDGALFVLACWEKPEGPRGNGWQIDRLAVDAAVNDAFDRFDVVWLYADPPHWQDYVDAWSVRHGERSVIEWWTNRGVPMAKALERLHTAVYAHEIIHDGNLLLARHVGNAVSVPRAGGTQVNKRRHGDKIDALVAATLAYEARNDAIAQGMAEAEATGWMVVLP